MEYSELIRDFLDDANAHLSALDRGLLALEKNTGGREVISDLLGSLHTLKGNSGMMGYESLKTYLHNLEELLKNMTQDETAPERVIGILMEGSNVIRRALHGIGVENGSSPDLAEEIVDLQRRFCGKVSSAAAREIDIAAYLGAKTDTIRVDFKKLDDLLNLAGELLICKTRLGRVETLIRPELRNKALTRELREGLDVLGKTISDLQEGVMRARMLPIRQVFGKFERLVRDLAKSQGKEIRLVLEGEETKIDKSIVDELEEPLMHLVRNAVDHGVELPAERAAQGKNREAVITLAAEQESNYVAITVRDDGKGINPEEIRAAAVRRGIIEASAQYEEHELLSLIFTAGFTTKEEISEISGRGIGLDVVSKRISKLNGHIAVFPANPGTAFTIKLPLSLAIIPALMAEAGGEVYAIPMSAVAESVTAEDRDLHMINNREVVRYRERVLPVVRLGEFFGLNGIKPRRFHVVIIGRAEKSIAVAVDRLRGKQDIVIKPLDDTFGRSYGIAGASILGDGRIVLIVDVTAFWNENRLKACRNQSFGGE